MKKDNYVIVNIWTAETNKALGGHNVGHVSIETKDNYYSLWPALRTIRDQIIEKNNQKVAAGLKPGLFEVRKADFKTSYMHDAVTEAYSEGRRRGPIASTQDLNFGEVAVIKNVETGKFQIAKSDADVTHASDCIYAVQPLLANVRLVLFGLNTQAINNNFREMDVRGWRMVGSNAFTRVLGAQTSESCASLAMRLLNAGGMYQLLSTIENSSAASQTSSVTKPEHLLKHVMKAKRYELQSHPDTANWKVPGVVQTALDSLERAYSDVSKTTENDLKKQEGSCIIF